MNIKQIVIALIDRLAAYAAREAESEDPEETKRQEEAAAKRLAERVKTQKAKIRHDVNGDDAAPAEADAWGSDPQSPVEAPVDGPAQELPVNGDKGKERADGAVPKFRGIPNDVKLFEVFWHQVVELIKASFYVFTLQRTLTFFLRPDQTYQYRTLPRFWFRSPTSH